MTMSMTYIKSISIHYCMVMVWVSVNLCRCWSKLCCQFWLQFKLFVGIKCSIVFVVSHRIVVLYCWWCICDHHPPKNINMRLIILKVQTFQFKLNMSDHLWRGVLEAIISYPLLGIHYHIIMDFCGPIRL